MILINRIAEVHLLTNTKQLAVANAIEEVKDNSNIMAVKSVNDKDTDIFHVENGFLKWDIQFDSLSDVPGDFKIEFDLDFSDGIIFYYQPALEEEWASGSKIQTLEEYLESHRRPDNIVGSYAVYCDKSNNKYATGKILHIERPLCIDNNGLTEWATLTITDTLLIIDLPKNFMLSSAYPVVLDPNLGYDTAGASNEHSNTILYVNKHNVTAGSNGDASKIYVYVMNEAGAPRNMALGFYDDNSSTPNNLVDSGTLAVNNYITPQWRTIDVTGTITSGNKYYPAMIITPDGNPDNYFYYDNLGVTSQGYAQGQTTLQDPCTGLTDENYCVSIYLEYTASGGGTEHMTGSADTITEASGTLGLWAKMSGTSDTITDSSGTMVLLKKISGIAETVTAGQSILTLLKKISGIAETITSGQSTITLYLKMTGLAESISELSGTLSLYYKMSGISESVSASSALMKLYLKITSLCESITSAQGTLSLSGTAHLSGIAETLSEAIGELSLILSQIPSIIVGEVGKQYIKGKIGNQYITGEIGKQYIKGNIN
jgi:hypothetical protein